MTNKQVWMATGAIVCAVLGGAIVWSVMTFTITKRADLSDLQADRTELGKCIAAQGAAVDTAKDAQAEAELLKTLPVK